MSNPNARRVQPFRRRLLQVAVASCFATAVHANPVGPSVVSGAATFNAVGKNLTVTNSPGAIINWQGFSIRPDEVTRFIQSGAASAVLNRVTGPEHSAILGQLLSNGRVFLINPNGVTVGAGARIDTAGFIASSLNLANEDFLAGKFRFTDPGNAGKVTNAGTINAHSGGLVYLVAPTVENHGVITAPNGVVILAAGKSVELVSTASPDIRVQVQAGGEALNVGQVVAESGRVGIFGAAIRNAGAVSADGAELTTAGTIVLRSSKDVTLEATSTLTANGAKGGAITVQAEGGTLLADGRIEAKGAQAAGGEVKLLGERVGLVNQASVNASGRTGGGTVLVGGDFQGANPDVQNAAWSFVGSQAAIRADATREGDGGKVVVWADQGTQYYGQVSARGGADGGDGGFAEVSAKGVLEFAGTVDLSAPVGASGTLLLDPSNITISTGANSNITPASPFTSTAATSVLNTGTLTGALATGNVIVETSGAFAAAGGLQNAITGDNTAGDIDVANAITWNSANSLTLLAHDDVVLRAAMTNNGIGAVNIASGWNGATDVYATIRTTPGDYGNGTGDTFVRAAVRLFGGDFTALGRSVAGIAAGTINTTGGAARNGGSVEITGKSGGTVTLAGAVTTTGGASGAGASGRNAGSVSLAGGTISVVNITATGSAATGPGAFPGGAGGAVSLDAIGAAPTITLGGNLDARGGNGVGGGVGGAGGAITALDPISLTGNRQVLSAGGTGGTPAGGAVQLGNVNSDLAAQRRQLTVTAGNAAVAVGSLGNVNPLGAISISGVGITAASASTVGLANGAGANVALNAGTGALNVGAIDTSAGARSVAGAGTNAGTVGLTGNTIAAGSITALGSNALGANSVGGNGGAVTVTRAGAPATITFNGLIDTRGGDSAGTGNTGTGGAVTIDGGVAPDLGSVTFAAGSGIDTRGGRGQQGGNVIVRDTSGVTMAAGTSIDTGGGVAASNGKNAGSVTINNATGLLDLQSINAQGSSAAAGSGLAGGAGGAVVLAGGGVALNGQIMTGGGNGDGAGAAGAGGAISATGGALGGATQAASSTVNAGSATILVDANDGAIDLAGTLTTTSNSATAVVVRDATTAALGNISAANGRVVLGQAGVNNLSGAVTQNAGTAITAASLSAVGGGAVTLANANQIGTLAGATAAGGFTLNNTNNPLTVSANVTTTNNPVAISVGTATYTQNNNVDISAGAGGITLTADQIAIGTNAGNNALATTGTLTLKPTSAAQPMRVGSTAGADTPLTFDLRAAEITAFATGATGPVVIGDAAASTAAMTIAGAVNLAGKTVTLNAGNLTDAGTQTITAQNLSLNARTGAIGAAGDAINVAVTNLRVTTQNQNAYVASAGGYNLGAAASSVGTGTLALAAGGAVTQSAGIPITAGSMVLTGAGGNFTLTQNNGVGTLAASTGAVNFVNGSALTVGTVNGVAGVSATGNVTLRTATGAGNDITLANNVAATGAGANVTLASGEDIHYGTATLAAGAGGRWLTYSVDPANDTGTLQNPGNAKPNIYNCNFGGPCGATIPATGNHHVYSDQPTLTYTADAAGRPYGDPNPAFTGTVAGLVNGDTVADAYTGTLAFTSPATPTSGIGGHAIDGSGLTSDIGYAFAQAPGNATALTIGQRALQVTADAGQSKIYGEANPPGYAYTLASGTLIGGDAFSGATTRLAGENVGNYAIQQGTLTVGPNYAITFVANDFAIVVRPITITANPAQVKVYGGADPVFAYGVAGGPGTTGPAIVAGDALVGAPGRAPGENVGPFAINQGTLAVNVPANYAVTFVSDNFTITPAPLTIAADNQARLYGDPNPPLTATFTGLTGGDTSAAISGLSLTTPATSASNVGPYTINVGSNPNSNYTITYANGVLTITPAPLAIAADDKTKSAGQPNPPFTATFTGFKLGQTVADLTGGLSFTTPATTGSPAGSYPITPGGVSSASYTITFVDGQLVVTAVPTPSSTFGSVATADNALITATQRSERSPTDELRPNGPLVRSTDCLVLETPAGRRTLDRCF